MFARLEWETEQVIFLVDERREIKGAASAHLYVAQVPPLAVEKCCLAEYCPLIAASIL